MSVCFFCLALHLQGWSYPDEEDDEEEDEDSEEEDDDALLSKEQKDALLYQVCLWLRGRQPFCAPCTHTHVNANNIVPAAQCHHK